MFHRRGDIPACHAGRRVPHYLKIGGLKTPSPLALYLSVKSMVKSPSIKNPVPSIENPLRQPIPNWRPWAPLPLCALCVLCG